MSSSKPLAARQAGFTLVELLIAAALGLLVSGILLNMLVSAGNVKARSSLQLSVDDGMRAALELMSMDLRESVGPRVLTTGGTPPGSLSSYASTSASFTVIKMPADQTLLVGAPNNYSSTNPSYSNSANTRVTQPNAAGNTCDTIFSGGDYAIVTSGTTSRWIQVQANNPCTGGANPAVLHPGYQLTYPYNPRATVGKVTAMQYAVQTIGGVSTLTRQIAGESAQVVLPNVVSLLVEYSTDGATFSTTPATPVAMRLTLTGQRTQGGRTTTLTLSNTVFMRTNAVPAPVTP